MLELKGVSKFYQNQGNVVLGLRRVSATFNKGEFVAITGESGSGKSTLLNVISGLDKYDEGDLFLNGESTSYFSIADLEKYRKEYIGFVFQDYNIIDAYTVYENVIAALVLQNYPKDKRKARALDLIERVGLTKQKNQKTSKLSGGQKQRVVIARALAKDAPIIVADEPTGNLDAKSGEMIMKLLKEVSKDKLVIVVTHNYEQVKEHVTRKIHMFDGEIVEDKYISIVEEDKIKPAINKPTNLLGHLYFAWTNILRNPKKTIILFLSYIILMSATLVTVAARKQNLLDPFFGHPFVENSFDKRVIVKKKDSSNFTDEELVSFYNNSYVKSVIHFDFVLDYHYSFNDLSGIKDIYSRNVLIPSSANLEVHEGRAPLNDKEIVIPKWYKDVTKIKVNYGISYGENAGYFDLNVVGYTKDNRFIVHDSLLNQTTKQKIVASDLFVKTQPNSYAEYVLGVQSTDFGHSIKRNLVRKNDSLTDEVIVSRGLLNIKNSNLNNGDLVYLTLNTDFFTKNARYTLIVVEDAEIYMEVPSDMYFEPTLNPNQISVVLKDSLDANRFMKSVDDKYMTLHPASYKPAGTSIFSIGAIFLGLNAIIFSIIILNIVIKNIYKAKNKDIAIMRSIGASKKDIRKIYLLETILTVFISTLITLLIVFLLGEYAFKKNLLKILGASLTLIYVSIFLGIGLLVINKFLNRLFGRTVIHTLRGGSDD